MTEHEWEQVRRKLQAAVTRAKTRMRNCGTLAEKRDAAYLVKAAEESLRLHKLNYYELVK